MVVVEIPGLALILKGMLLMFPDLGWYSFYVFLSLPLFEINDIPFYS